MDRSIVYGPILSRRLGRSLGVNLLGQAQKVCNFNCVYCECGRTPDFTASEASEIYPPIEDVLGELEAVLRKPHSLDHITFSGNGEPTLHPQFLEIVQETCKLRERYKPQAEIAVFSNGSRAQNWAVLEALNLVDKPIMKLDVGDETGFVRVNEPLCDIQLEDIVQAYKHIKGCILQSMFIGEEKGNADGRSVGLWVERVAEIQPKAVQIYSLERLAPDPGVERLSKEELQELSLLYSEKFHFPIHVYYS